MVTPWCIWLTAELVRGAYEQANEDGAEEEEDQKEDKKYLIDGSKWVLKDGTKFVSYRR